MPNLKILFTSGYTDDTIFRHGVIETNTNFIQKPCTPETLANKIIELLDNAAQVQIKDGEEQIFRSPKSAK